MRVLVPDDAMSARILQRQLRRMDKGAERRAHAVHTSRLHRVGFAALSPPCKYQRKIRKRNADRRSVSCSAPAGAARATRVPACADPPLRARSPVGVPPRFFPWDCASPRCSFRPCFRGIGGALDLLLPRQGEDRAQFVRALPAPTCPFIVQRAPRVLVRSAGRLMPEAARERIASPRAGTALAPPPGMPPEGDTLFRHPEVRAKRASKDERPRRASAVALRGSSLRTERLRVTGQRPPIPGRAGPAKPALCNCHHGDAKFH